MVTMLNILMDVMENYVELLESAANESEYANS